MVRLFAGMSYYPEGGALDYVGAFPSDQEALVWCHASEAEWAHVTDDDLQILSSWRRVRTTLGYGWVTDDR